MSILPLVFSPSRCAQSEGGGHGDDVPEWSRLKCVVVLACGVAAFAAIGEKMCSVLDEALASIGVSEAFAGVRALREGWEQTGGGEGESVCSLLSVLTPFACTLTITSAGARALKAPRRGG